MTNQHSEQTGRPPRRHRCEEQMRSGVRLLVENACVQGFTREEALIAISDAADAELADLTESFADGASLCPDIVPFPGLRH